MGKEVSGIGNDVANNGWDEISQRGAHEVSTKPKDDGYPLRLDICNWAHIDIKHGIAKGIHAVRIYNRAWYQPKKYSYHLG